MIIVRKDLNMRAGKIAAQVAHASMKIVLDRMHKRSLLYSIQKWSLLLSERSPMFSWLNDRFTKIVVYVNSLEELMDIKNKAEELDIPNAIITDLGKTEFHNQPTITCVAIGPDWSEKIDQVTGDLPLL